MLRTSAEITCEAALFLNDKEKIKAKCNFTFLLNKIKPHILELPLSKMLIYQTSSFTLRCRDNLKNCWITARLTGYKVVMSLVSLLHKIIF
jgi:hypothetical protein